MSKNFEQIWSENNPLGPQDDILTTIAEERAKAFKGGEMFMQDRVVAYLESRKKHFGCARDFCPQCIYTQQIINFVKGDPTDE